MRPVRKIFDMLENHSEGEIYAIYKYMSIFITNTIKSVTTYKEICIFSCQLPSAIVAHRVIYK